MTTYIEGKEFKESLQLDLENLNPREPQERILFDAPYKTFRLYAGNSLYAFSISPELSLEHLYWGKALPRGYDLRYLSQSSRASHFHTAELYESVAEDEVRDSLFQDLKWVSIETLQDTWRKNRNVKVSDINDSEAVQQRRLENLSWRLMSKLSCESCPTPRIRKSASCLDITPIKTVSIAGDLHLADENDFCNDQFQSDVEYFLTPQRSRSRSVSNPTAMVTIDENDDISTKSGRLR